MNILHKTQMYLRSLYLMTGFLLSKNHLDFIRNIKQGFHDGQKRGFSDGQKRGFSDGRKQGFHDGRKKGQKAGIRKGRQMALTEITKKKLAKGESLLKIAHDLELPLETVETIVQQISEKCP